jgi:hypothetical protein
LIKRIGMPLCLRRAYPRQVKTLIYASFIACCDIYATHLYHTESITMWYLCHTNDLFLFWCRFCLTLDGTPDIIRW